MLCWLVPLWRMIVVLSILMEAHDVLFGECGVECGVKVSKRRETDPEKIEKIL